MKAQKGTALMRDMKELRGAIPMRTEAMCTDAIKEGRTIT